MIVLIMKGHLSQDHQEVWLVLPHSWSLFLSVISARVMV